MKRDRLSSLPVEILCHILSFLPSNYSIKTSILATKFRYLWRLVPVLDFRDNLLRHPEISFEKLVDGALETHESLSSVRVLRFRCYHRGENYKNSISRWVDASATATSFKLEVLDVYVAPRYRSCWFELPSSVYSCHHNLNTLRLCGVIIHDNYISSRDVFFPCLKTLRLESVSFTGIHALNKLLLNSPSLQVIHIQDCSRKNGKNLVVGPIDDHVFYPCLKTLWLESVFFKGGINALMNKFLLGSPNSLQVIHIEDCFGKSTEADVRLVIGPIDDNVFYPCLKTLWLESISFAGTNALNKLLSGSPSSLQVIHIRRCQAIALVDVDDDVFFPCLKTLRLESISFRSASALNKLLISNPEIIHIERCSLITSDHMQDWSLPVTSDLITRPDLHIETNCSFEVHDSYGQEQRYWRQNIAIYSQKKVKKHRCRFQCSAFWF